MFNITSKYFSFFNNKPSASLVAHITRDFFTCYFCLYYSSMKISIFFGGFNEFQGHRMNKGQGFFINFFW